MDIKDQQTCVSENQSSGLDQGKMIIQFSAESDNYILTEQDDFDFVQYYLQLYGRPTPNQHPGKYEENNNK